jgi:hypothetical protein
VSNLQSTMLYYLAGGHICKFCTSYKIVH